MKPQEKQSRASGFAWDAERAFPLIFAGLVLLSLLAHIATFFLFQVTYPQRVTIPPLAPQVTVLSPDFPEHQPLLAWIAAEDPALSAQTARAIAPGIQEVPYQPSYALVRTWPLPAPRVVEPVPLPPARSGLELLDTAIHAFTPAQNSLSPLRTTVRVSESLAARALQGDFEVDMKVSAPLRPAEFLLGVNEAGEIRYSFLHRSSGDKEIDDAAAQALAKLSFASASEPITWGFVTISWGDEIYARAVNSQSAR